MRRKRFYVTLLVFVIFMAIPNAGCKQRDLNAYLYKLPEATSIGANTFGCICNGEVYSCRGKRERGWMSLSVQGVKVNVYEESIIIDAMFLSVPEKAKDRIHIEFNSNKYECGFFTDVYGIVPGSGFVEITRFDRSVLAGIFCFNQYFGTDSSIIDTYVDGRFDIQLSEDDFL